MAADLAKVIVDLAGNLVSSSGVRVYHSTSTLKLTTAITSLTKDPANQKWSGSPTSNSYTNDGTADTINKFIFPSTTYGDITADSFSVSVAATKVFTLDTITITIT